MARKRRPGRRRIASGSIDQPRGPRHATRTRHSTHTYNRRHISRARRPNRTQRRRPSAHHSGTYYRCARVRRSRRRRPHTATTRPPPRATTPRFDGPTRPRRAPRRRCRPARRQRCRPPLVPSKYSTPAGSTQDRGWSAPTQMADPRRPTISRPSRMAVEWRRPEAAEAPPMGSAAGATAQICEQQLGGGFSLSWRGPQGVAGRRQVAREPARAAEKKTTDSGGSRMARRRGGARTIYMRRTCREWPT